MPRLLTLQLAALPLDPTPLVQMTFQCTSVLTMPSRCTFLLSPCSLAPCTFWSPGRWASLECAWRASPGRSTTSLMRATVAARGPMPSFPISTTTLRTMGWGRSKEVHLHCDNCSGQNKNQYVLAYLMWRVITGRHKSISLNFLITGHTKFAPDWCFGLLKQKFRKEPVSSLEEMAATVRRSTLQEVNIPQLVGDERGTVLVPMYDWQAFLIPFSKAVKGIKQYHHFSFTHQAQGVAMAITHSEGPTQILPVLVGDAGAVPHAPPPRVQSPGLSAYRQWYLFNSIRDFCTDNTKDIMCPKPTVPQPGPAPPTRQIAAPLPQDEADPEGVVVVVVVVVVVKAEEGGEAVGEGELHKGYQTQNHHLHWRRRRRK